RFVTRPISGRRANLKRRRSESNRRIEVLQTSALPLGYGAERDKLASCLVFLNPPRGKLLNLSQTSALLLGSVAVCGLLTSPDPWISQSLAVPTFTCLNLIGDNFAGIAFRS